jgi:hypothetical protein
MLHPIYEKTGINLMAAHLAEVCTLLLHNTTKMVSMTASEYNNSIGFPILTLHLHLNSALSALSLGDDSLLVLAQ